MSESQRRTAGRGPGRSQAKERSWRQLVERQRRSNLTVRGFCAQAGISEPSFYAWRSELARRDSDAGQPVPSESQTARPTAPSTPRFLPVTITEYQRAAASHVEVVMPSGLLVRVPAQDTAALRTVLEVLEQRPC
jgi:hypothetical protein